MALATLTVDLILKAGGFESDMGRASKTAQKRMKEIETGAKKMGVALGVALAAGVTALGYAVKKAIDHADELYNAAQKIGVSVEALSGLEYAAKQAGVGLDELQGALGKYVKFQASAAQGNDDAIATFKAFGIQIKDAAGNLRDSQSSLLDWAELFSKLPDGAGKAALAMEVFGKSGRDMIPLLNEGRGGISDLIAEAERLGIVISTETGKQADELNDQIDALKASFNGAALELARQMLPHLIELTEWLRDSTEEGSKLITVSEGIAKAIGWAGSVIGGAVEVVEYLGVAFGHAVTQGENLLTMWDKVTSLDFEGVLATRQKILRDHATAVDMVSQNDPAIAIGAQAMLGLVPTSLAGAAPPKAGAEPESDAARALREWTEEQEKGNAASKAAAAARRAAAEAAREQAERERELAEAVKRVTEASAEFRETAEDRAAQLAGPLAEAALQYSRDLADLRDLAKTGEIGTVELTKAEADLAAQYRDTTAAIEERLNPGKQVLDDLQFQLELTQMATQFERDRAIFLRENINATNEQADAYARLQGQLEESREAISAADEFRDSVADFAASAITDINNIGDAFDNLADQILASAARAMANKWVEQLLGSWGTALGGGGGAGSFEGLGGFFGSAKGNVFDGGNVVTAFARGGIVDGPTIFPMARGMGLMGEAGPEAVIPLTRDSQGRLGVRGGGFQQTNNFLLQGRPEQKTQDQMAQRAGRSARRAMARFD